VRVFFEEMMLDRPHVIEAQLVGELHLLKAVVVDRALFLGRPGTRDGDLVEQAEFHRQPPVVLGETLGLQAKGRNSTMRSEGEIE
jgi:hypothetical protein